MAERPSVCAHCGKRLSKKQWYYRNGQFFCKQRCFRDAQAKALEEKAKAAEVKAVEAPKTAQAEAAAKSSTVPAAQAKEGSPASS